MALKDIPLPPGCEMRIDQMGPASKLSAGGIRILIIMPGLTDAEIAPAYEAMNEQLKTFGELTLKASIASPVLPIKDA